MHNQQRTESIVWFYNREFAFDGSTVSGKSSYSKYDQVIWIAFSDHHFYPLVNVARQCCYLKYKIEFRRD